MDKLIIGAGLYGLYAALYCGKRGQQVEVLEIEQAPFTRATYYQSGQSSHGLPLSQISVHRYEISGVFQAFCGGLFLLYSYEV